MANRREVKNTFTPTTETIPKDRKKLEELAELLNNNPNAPSSDLKLILDKTEITLLSELFPYKPNLKCTALYFICTVGKLDYVKDLIISRPSLKLDGPQEEKGGTPIFAAQSVGQVRIVALLILFGAIPDLNALRPHLFVKNTELSNTGVLAQFRDLYDTFSSSGCVGVGIDFPEEAEFYSKFKPQDRKAMDGMSVISSNLETKSRFKYKKRYPIQVPGLVDSLYKSIEHILQTNNVRQNIEEWIQEKKDDIINGLTLTGSSGATNSASPGPKPAVKKDSFSLRKIPVLSPVYAVTQRYNVNVVIFLYNPHSEKKVLKRVLYVNAHKKNAFPTIYLAYDGTHYEPIVDIPEESSGTTPVILYEAIKNPKTTLEEFSNLLDNYDTSKINDIQLLEGRNRTLFYCACRGGRADIVLRMIDIPNLSVTGAQDRESASTPLHVASWYGHTDVMIILLFKEADPEATNAHGEKARLFDENLPAEKKKKITEIWEIYDSKNHDRLAQELDAISTSMEVKTNSQASNVPLSPGANPYASNDKGPVTLEKLCDLLKGDTPPHPDVFRDHFARFDKKFINDFSVKEKVTPFYLACRSGSLEIVMEFMDVEGIKLTGQQETRTPEGNTPLHVANWRGHVPVVAYLLTRVEPEPKSNGNFPGVAPEIFQGKGSENDIKRTQLAKVFAFAKQPGKEERLRPYWQDVRLPKTTPPIPLSVSLSLPAEEVPPQYLRLQYLWYAKSNKLTLLDLHTSSCLDTEYRKWCEAPPTPDTAEVDVFIYTPPARGALVWAKTIWKVNFKQFLATVPGQSAKILLYPIKRAQIWYWKSREGPYIPFSNKNNIAIGEALHKKQASVKFVVSETGLLFFKNKVTCAIDFQTRQATMTDAKGVYFPVIHEGEYTGICNWHPDDIKFTERRSVSMEEGEIILNEEAEEWKQVSAAFYATVPQLQLKKNKLVEANRIVQIKKLFHPTNRDTFIKNYTRTLGYHKDNPIGDFIEYKKILWHGTGSLDPQVIWSTPGNWKPNYSSDKNLWGRGCYFASDAAYSANYAYTKADTNTKILLLAEVIVGQTIQCMENSCIVDNPPTQYINCVVGYRHGAWIYVVYEPALAYPVYSVEWKEL